MYRDNVSSRFSEAVAGLMHEEAIAFSRASPLHTRQLEGCTDHRDCWTVVESFPLHVTARIVLNEATTAAVSKTLTTAGLSTALFLYFLHMGAKAFHGTLFLLFTCLSHVAGVLHRPLHILGVPAVSVEESSIQTRPFPIHASALKQPGPICCATILFIARRSRPQPILAWWMYRAKLKSSPDGVVSCSAC